MVGLARASNAELRCRVSGTASGAFTEIVPKATLDWNQDYIVAVRGRKMVKSFLPSRTTAVEINLDSDMLTEIDFQRKTFSRTSIHDFANAFNDLSRATVPPGNQPASVRISAHQAPSIGQVMGQDTTTISFSTEIHLPIGRPAGEEQKPIVADELEAVVSGELQMVREIQGYEAFRQFQDALATKFAKEAAAVSRFNFLQYGGIDAGGVVSAILLQEAKLSGMPVFERVSVSASVGSDHIHNPGDERKPLAVIEVTYQWYSTPESEGDPFVTNATLATFREVESDITRKMKQKLGTVTEPDDGHPPVLRHGRPPAYQKKNNQ